MLSTHFHTQRDGEREREVGAQQETRNATGDVSVSVMV